MAKELFVSFFQSPSNGMRRAIIWKELPRNKIDLKYHVVEQIELNKLPEDSVLGDILLVDDTCVDLIQDWTQYKVGLDTVYECALDSMHHPKRGNNTFYPVNLNQEPVTEDVEYVPVSDSAEWTEVLPEETKEVKDTMIVGTYPDSELRKTNKPKDRI